MKGRPGGQEMFCLQGLLKWDLNGTMTHSAGSSAAGYFLGHIRLREPTALYLLPKIDVALHACCILAVSPVWL